MEPANLQVKLDLGADNVLVAGEEELVALEVTNQGAEPLYRLAAVVGDHPLLGSREFLFGRLDPGQTRRFEQLVAVDAGYPSEASELMLNFRTSDQVEFWSEPTAMQVRGRGLPEFSWSWEVVAPDGGPLHVGSEALVKLSVLNIGEGPTVGAVARIRNGSGKALDILTGTVEPGFMVDDHGARCVVVTPGVEAGSVLGETDNPAEVIEAGVSPKYADGCHRALAPGERWSGEFRVKLKEHQVEGYLVKLTLGDAEAYDVGTVMRSAFYSYFMQDEEIRFNSGNAQGPGQMRAPPTVEITRHPEPRVDSSRVSVSGVVRDDVGLANVVVYAGGNKVFFEGSRSGVVVSQVPFTAEVTLEPGSNVVSVLATDVDGFTSTDSVVVYFDDPGSRVVLSTE